MISIVHVSVRVAPIDLIGRHGLIIIVTIFSEVKKVRFTLFSSLRGISGYSEVF